MKVILICNAPASMHWEGRYTSEEFDKAIDAYAACGIVTSQVEPFQTREKKIYTAASRRSLETAGMLFGEVQYEILPLLDEGYPRSFMDTKRRYPLWLWRAAAKFQSFFGSKRQLFSGREIKARARSVVKTLTQKGEDSVVICDAGMLSALIREFDSAGFVAKRMHMFSIKPLERVAVTQKAMHCGNCQHNCLLTNPGCGIGKEKAFS